jgi:hypothetical protein
VGELDAGRAFLEAAAQRRSTACRAGGESWRARGGGCRCVSPARGSPGVARDRSASTSAAQASRPMQAVGAGGTPILRAMRPVPGDHRWLRCVAQLLVAGHHIAQRRAVMQHIVPGQRMPGARLRCAPDNVRFATIHGAYPAPLVAASHSGRGADEHMRDQEQRRGPDQLTRHNADAAVLGGKIDVAEDVPLALLDRGTPSRRPASAPYCAPHGPGRAPARRCPPARSAPGPRRRGRRSSAGRPRPRSARRRCRSRRGRRSRPASAGRAPCSPRCSSQSRMVDAGPAPAVSGRGRTAPAAGQRGGVPRTVAALAQFG